MIIQILERAAEYAVIGWCLTVGAVFVVGMLAEGILAWRGHQPS